MTHVFFRYFIYGHDVDREMDDKAVDFQKMVFSRLRQWCAAHLHMVAWAHQSAQPKRQLDRFSSSCTGRGRMSFPPKNCRLAWCHMK